MHDSNLLGRWVKKCRCNWKRGMSGLEPRLAYSSALHFALSAHIRFVFRYALGYHAIVKEVEWNVQGSRFVCRRKWPPVGGDFRRQTKRDPCTNSGGSLPTYFFWKKVHDHSSCVPIRKSIMPPAPLSDRLRWSPSPVGISVASTRDTRARRRKRTLIRCGRTKMGYDMMAFYFSA